MESRSGRIGIQLTQRSKPGKEAFDYRSAATRRWVEELPTANIGEMAKRLFSVLQEVNQLDLPWKERLAFLELLRDTNLYIQQALLRHYAGRPLPLAEKAQRVATLAQTLSMEMAMGYKVALDDMLGSSILTRDNKALSQLIHRAIRYLSQAIIAAYQTYAPPPPHSWHDLHQLYRYAEEKGFQRNPVHDALNPAMPESSIARVYKQLLLLALASPYSLKLGETEAVYAMLINWGGHAQLLPYNDPQADEALFVVALDQDDAPDYRAFSHQACTQAQCRLLDTRQLSQVLQNELAEQRRSKSPPPLSSDLLFRLICAWSAAPKRHFSRNNQQGSCEVVVGTTMLHHLLAQQSSDALLFNPPASYESHGVSRLPRTVQTSQEDLWNPFTSHTMKQYYADYSQSQPKDATRPASPAASMPRMQQWQIHNEGAGGLRLLVDKAQECKVQIGELVGIRRRSDRPCWEVGVVRWLRHHDEADLEVGVQNLAPSPRPAMVKKAQAGGRAAEFQYALLLPEVAPLKLPATIITSALLFQPGDELLLHLPDQQMPVWLEHAIEDTGNFVQFRYRTRDSQSSDAQTDPVDADLGDLWETL